MATIDQSTTYTRDFVMVASSDHIAALTGATVTVTLSKAGAAFGAAAGTVTEIGSGHYKIALTTADTNTAGDLGFHCTAASGDPSDFVDQVRATASALATAAAVAAVQADTDDIQARLPAALVSGRIDASVGAMAADTVNASALSADAGTELGTAVWATTTRAITDKAGFSLSAAGVQAIWDALTSALTTVGSVGKRISDNLDVVLSTRASSAALATVQTDTDDIQARLPAALVGGRMDSSIGALAAAGITAIADAVLNAVASSYNTALSIGNKINAAGSAGDPWTTALPGAYGAGTAGKIVGDNVNATISSRASQTSLDTVDDFIDTEITDIRNRLPAALVSGRIDASVGAMAADVLTATAIATDAITSAELAPSAVAEIQAAVAAGSVASVVGAVGSVTGNVGGNVTGSVGSVVGAVGSVTAGVTVSDKTGFALSAAAIDAILDDTIGDGTITARQALRVLVAGMAGKLSGAATATVTIRNLADSADVVVATVDASGNRSAVAVTP